MPKHIVIDEEKCMGCCACEIACKMEYQLPKGVRFIIMNENEDQTPGKEKLRFSFSICRQCSYATCMENCPTGALWRDGDGVIRIDENTCIGCRRCAEACSYGVPQFGITGTMQKCQLCQERRGKGLLPACMTACPAKAISF